MNHKRPNAADILPDFRYFSYTEQKPSQYDDVPSVFFRGIDQSGGLQRDAFMICPQVRKLDSLSILHHYN